MPDLVAASTEQVAFSDMQSDGQLRLVAHDDPGAVHLKCNSSREYLHGALVCIRQTHEMVHFVLANPSIICTSLLGTAHLSKGIITHPSVITRNLLLPLLVRSRKQGIIRGHVPPNHGQ